MPAEWMCPACASLVERGARGCDRCGVAFSGKHRAVRVRGTRTSLRDHAVTVWGVWLIATLVFVVFAMVARQDVVIARAYVAAVLAFYVAGLGLVVFNKAGEGLLELVFYFARGRWIVMKDPMDRWMAMLLVVLAEGFGLLWFVVMPGLPRGANVWAW